MQCFVIDCRLQERILQMLTNIEKRKKDFEAPWKMDETSDLFLHGLVDDV